MRVLFICKKNETYGFITYTRRSSGLYNSTRFIVEGLRDRGVHAHIVEVIDNNCIDREVQKFKPDVVVIEALWVVPSKFEVLKRLHPAVKWFIHLHSHMPFLALEGIAMEWVRQYAKDEIGLIANSPESFLALRCILGREEIIFLPNVYRGFMFPPKSYDWNSEFINVSCFGAVRPLKNHLLQALAAIRFAKELGKRLKFYINATRVETGGQPVLKNLRQLFADEPGAELVEVHWCEPDEFHGILRRDVDIGMQVSLTETFNVVSADYVTSGLPVVASKEVKWLSDFNKAEDDNVNSIVGRLHSTLGAKILIYWNQRLLRNYGRQSEQLWFDWLRSLSRD